MKKFSVIFVSALVLVVLASCASTQPAEVTQTEVQAKNHGLEDLDAPDWFFIKPTAQDYYYEAAYAKQSNLQNSIKRATAEARNLIAEYINTAVDEIITTYTNDAGVDADRQAVDAFETLSKQRAQAIVSGVSVEDRYVDSEGGVYLLVSIPKANIAQEFQATAESSFKKNAAAAEANNMMNAAIAKYFGSSSVTE